MQRAKQFWQTLNHVSTIAWIWGLGGALVLTTLAGWIAQARAGMPLGWLVLGSLGVALLSFMALVSMMAKVFPGWATPGPVMHGPTDAVSSVTEGSAYLEPQKTTNPFSDEHPGIYINVAIHRTSMPWGALKDSLKRGIAPVFIGREPSPSILTVTIRSTLTRSLRSAMLELKEIDSDRHTFKVLGSISRATNGGQADEFVEVSQTERSTIKVTVGDILSGMSKGAQFVVYTGYRDEPEFAWFVSESDQEVASGLVNFMEVKKV